MEDIYEELNKEKPTIKQNEVARGLRKALGPFFDEVVDKVSSLTEKEGVKRVEVVNQIRTSDKLEERSDLKGEEELRKLEIEKLKDSEIRKIQIDVEHKGIPTTQKVEVGNFPEFPESQKVELDQKVVLEKLEELKLDLTKTLKDLVIKKVEEAVKVDFPESQKVELEFPEVQKVEVNNQPTSFKVDNFNELKLPEYPKTVKADVTFPKVQDVKVTNPPVIEQVKFPTTQKVEGMVGLKEGTIPTGDGVEVDVKKANPSKYSIVRVTNGKQFIDDFGGGGAMMTGGGGGGKGITDTIIAQGSIDWIYNGTITTATTTTLRPVGTNETLYVIGIELSTNVAQRMTLQVGSKVFYAGNFGATGGAVTRSWMEKARGSGIVGDDLTITTNASGQVDVSVTYVIIATS